MLWNAQEQMAMIYAKFWGRTTHVLETLTVMAIQVKLARRPLPSLQQSLFQLLHRH